MTPTKTVEKFLASPEVTSAVGQRLAGVAQPGDCLLLHGDIGAGKTHLARAFIQAWLQAQGRWEAVPSPTYTLVQTYSDGEGELWHADLYRLTSANDIEELGLLDAIGTAIVLVEWPDRLGEDAPGNALHVTLSVAGDGRTLHASGPARLISAIESIA